jgi:hypothetical protein
VPSSGSITQVYSLDPSVNSLSSERMAWSGNSFSMTVVMIRFDW